MYIYLLAQVDFSCLSELQHSTANALKQHLINSRLFFNIVWDHLARYIDNYIVTLKPKCGGIVFDADGYCTANSSIFAHMHVCTYTAGPHIFCSSTTVGNPHINPILPSGAPCDQLSPSDAVLLASLNDRMFSSI